MLFAFDQKCREKYGVFCGVDEAGRGPLAGDVYAAAVVLPENIDIKGLNDSKKISAAKREKLHLIILEKATAYSIATASVAEIEQFNILQATFLAMQRAVNNLAYPIHFILVDGNRLPTFSFPAEPLIKGDGISASIAAASILAKVSRDHYMQKMAQKYPEYQFERHKGYGTKLHYEMLQKYGPCPLHRESFLKNLLIKETER